MSYPIPPNQPDSGQPDFGQPAYPPPPSPPAPPVSGQPAYPPPPAAPAASASGQPGYPQSPGYPAQPGYPQPAYAVAPVNASTKGPKVLTFLGIASLILGVVGFAVGMAMMVKPVQAIIDGSGSGVISQIRSGDTVTTDLTGNKTYALWIIFDSGSGTYTGKPSVTGPDGRDVSLTSTNTTGANSSEVGGAWIFTTDEAGLYTLSAPELSSGKVVLTSEDLIVNLGVGAVLILVGGGFGVVGLGLTIGGGIWWHSRKKKARALAGPSYA